MAPNSPAQLLGLLRRNSLLPDSQLKQLAKELANFQSASELAKYLVENDWLTAWQARQLLSGEQSPGLGQSQVDMAQYRVIEGLTKESFGKRFVAVHNQLDRTVEVQVLSQKISDETFDRSREKIKAVASLDHPNLVSCLEIDRVKGRFVVIAEKPTGKTLKEADLSQLTELDVAKMVRQCLAGLMDAHRHDVIHGELDLSRIVIEQEGFKIRDFAIMNLQRVALGDAAQQPDAASDLFGLAEIGLELLHQIPADDSGDRKRLLKILSNLGVVPVGNVSDQLDKWIGDNQMQPTSQTALWKEVNAGPEPARSGAVHSGEPVIAAGQSNDQPENEAASSEYNDQRAVSRKRKSVAALIGAIALGCVVVFSLFGYWANMRSERSKSSSNPDGQQLAQVNDDGNPQSPTSETEESGPADDGWDPSIKIPDLEINEDSNQTVDVDPVPGPGQTDPDAKEPVDDTVTVAEASTPEKSSATNDGSESESSESKSSESKSNEPKSNTETPADLVAKITSKQPAPGKPEIEYPQLPFRDFAPHIELPPLDDTGPMEVDKLVIRPNYLLGAKLFISEDAARKTGTFELRRSDEDKQRWLVSRKKSRNADPVDVAAFWKSENTFFFQWLSAAKLDEDVNYLRNGALKLETPDGQHAWMNLRSPVTIEGFALADQKGVAEVKLELPWLPSSKVIIVEIAGFADRAVPSICEREYVQPRAPGVMYFTTVPGEEFIWMEVSASLRKQLELEAALKINELGAVKPLAPPALAQYQQANQVIAQNAAAMIKATKDNDLKKQYQAVQSAANKTAKVFAKYAEILPQLEGKSIPIAIYIQVDEKHQLLLAKSPGFGVF